MFDTRHGTVESFWEQTQLNYNVRLLQIPVHDITFRFNHTRAAGEPPPRMDSDFVHYCGPGHGEGPRVGQIADDIRLFADQRNDWRQIPADVLAAMNSLEQDRL